MKKAVVIYTQWTLMCQVMGILFTQFLLQNRECNSQATHVILMDVVLVDVNFISFSFNKQNRTVDSQMRAQFAKEIISTYIVPDWFTYANSHESFLHVGCQGAICNVLQLLQFSFGNVLQLLQISFCNVLQFSFCEWAFVPSSSTVILSVY